MEMDPSSDLDIKSDFPSITDVEVMEKQFDKLPHETMETSHIIWDITDWSGLQDKVNSATIQCGGQTWRILLFPKGNSSSGDIVSAYCEVVPPEDADDQWSVCAQFILGLGNSSDPEVNHFQQACHRFYKGETDWGFSRMIEAKHLRTASAGRPRPILEDNSLTISLYVRVIKDPTGVLWHNFVNYDSKKQTGYVGLLNQGATCYMNSLLQSLYFTNYFRKAVYQIPTKEDTPQNSVALALQRVFLQLQNSDVAVGTNELTKSFGWDSIDSFMQHDIQEFNRVLQDNLEGKMKGTDAEGAIQRLFVGKMKSYITCIDVHYESSRVEDYYDIQLNVKGCQGVRESFEKYVDVEILDGDNKYMAEGHGLQDAKKGVIFDSFPPVLHLQLKRFDYDIMRDAMVKINDRYEFPDQINLDDFVSPDADRTESYDYVLHGVLVHSGDLHGGHYFALLKPTPGGNWFKFDDDRVTPALDNEVFEDNFGGEAAPHAGFRPNTRAMKRFSNAYMLVYIRKSRLQEILSDVTAEDIPDHLRQRQQFESDAQLAASKRRLEQDQQVLFQVLSDDSISKHHLAGLADLNNPQAGHLILPCPKNQTLGWLKEHLGQTFNLKPGSFRLWIVESRQNNTLRPQSLLDETNLDISLAYIRDRSFGHSQTCIVYLETPNRYIESSVVSGQEDAYLILAKYFNRNTQTLDYLGKFYAPRRALIGDIAKEFVARLNLPPGTELELFDEVKPNQIDQLALHHTVDKAGLESGDILCLQMALPEESNVLGVVDYFEELNSQVRVYFKPKATVARMNVVDYATDISLDLNKKMPYSHFVGLLACQIQADPLKIRLHAPGGIRSMITSPVPYEPNSLLEDVLRVTPSPNYDSLLYYEVLDVTVTELESKTPLEIHLLGNTHREVAKITILAPKDGCFDDASNILQAKLQESNPDPITLRLYESDHGRFARILDQTVSIHEVPASSVIYAETLPLTHESNEIQIIHFSKEPSRTYGIPFLFPILKQEETLAAFSVRLASRLGISNKEFSKIRLAVLTKGDPFEILRNYIESEEEWNSFTVDNDCCLGLDHPDKTPRPSRFAEKAIKIFN